MKRWAWRFAAALLGLWVVAALYSLRPVDHDPEPITYVLTWEWGDARVSGDGSWSVTSDLGYEIEVLEGHVVAYEATAIACRDESSWVDGLVSLADAVLPATAWAGHGESADETVVTEVVESLSDPQDVTLGAGLTTASTYCESHLAFGISEPDATSLQLRLVVNGSTTLEVETQLSWGVLGELTGEFAGEHRVVQIVRDLSTVFDGIDFDALDDAQVAEAILRGLSGSTVFVAA